MIGRTPSVTSLGSEPAASAAVTLVRIKAIAATVLVLLAVNGALPLLGHEPIGAGPAAAAVPTVEIPAPAATKAGAKPGK